MQVYAVREVTTYLRELLETNPRLEDLWIAGEVSNVSRPASGHTYFTLKDGDAALKGVFFAKRYGARGTAHLLANGVAVLAHGRVTLYEQRGDLQVIVDDVQPAGMGALQAEYERLKARLEAEGLFDPSRKRPLPRMPRRIGVVTSETGAVLQDIRHVLERRWPIAELVLSPTPVQGPDAVRGIVGALDQLNDRAAADVIIAARGGGSAEELWSFNDEHVARAIFSSVIPVVSAVGHETDYTIADFVADRRAPTPSAAAEIVAPDAGEVRLRIRDHADRMESLLGRSVTERRAGIGGWLRIMDRRMPDVSRERQRIDDQTRRAEGAATKRHALAVSGVGNCVWRLKALDPYATLDRGYAIVQCGKTVVSSVAAVAPGDALSVRLRDGAFGAHVDGGAGAPKARKRPRRSVPDAQAPLFSMPEERA